MKTINNIKVEIKINNFNNEGKLVDAIVGVAKLEKESSNREGYKDVDSLTFIPDGCGCPKMSFDYNGSALEGNDNGEKNTTLELMYKHQKMDWSKTELVDAIAASSKLSKADAGSKKGDMIEDYFHLEVEKAKGNGDCGCGDREIACQCPKAKSFYNTVVTHQAA